MWSLPDSSSVLMSQGGSCHTQLVSWIFMSGIQFSGSNPGDHPWAPGSNGLLSWVHGSVTIRETVLSRLPLPGHCADSRLKHTVSFCERGLFASYGSLAQGAGFWAGTPLVTCRGALRKQFWGHHLYALPLSHYSLTVSARLECIHFSVAPIFAPVTSRSPALVVSRAYLVVPQDCMYLHTLKAAS